MAKKAADEEKMRQAVASDPKKRAEFGDPWPEIAKAMDVQKQIYLPLTYLERRGGFRGDLAGIARILVRAADGKSQAQWRAAARIPRLRAAFAGTGAFLDRADLQIAGKVAARGFARGDDRENARRPGRGARAERQVAGVIGRMIGSTIPSWMTWPCASSFTKAGKRPSRPAPIRSSWLCAISIPRRARFASAMTTKSMRL